MDSTGGERPCSIPGPACQDGYSLSVGANLAAPRFRGLASRRLGPTCQIRGVLVIDAANVIGSKPNGWWRDRPGSARRFVEKLRDAGKQGRIPLPAVVVLEGAARAGVAEEDVDGVRVVHAAHHGDEALVAETAAAASRVVFVSADRRLLERVRDLGAETVGTSWLNERLAPDDA